MPNAMPISDPKDLVPPLDLSGLPAPYWVFILLMNLTLVLHFILIGYIFTSTLLQIFFTAGARAGSAAEWMLRRTEKPLPVIISFAVTLGVAPLLFVQVLYQPFFYPANIVIGFQWFAIVPVAIAVFYAIYVLQGGGHSWTGASRAGGSWPAASSSSPASSIFSPP